MKIREILSDYFIHMRMIGRSERTIRTVRYDLDQLVRFLEQEKITKLKNLTHEVLADYQMELSFRLTARGNLLTLGSQQRLLGAVKVFTRYLKAEDYLLIDPGEKIHLPKPGRRLPRVILTRSDIHKLIFACEKNNRGFRNRIIIELLYDTAVRRAELSHMKISDMDLSTGYIRVTGKGNKDRVVPLSQRVCALVREYILQVRPLLLGTCEDKGYLILSHHGSRLTGDGIWYVIKKVCRLSGIKKKVTTHTFRHTCVTHMLKNGAPVRHLQEMLGHESLESTQLYTHVTINDLKEIHAKYHPSGSTAFNM